MANGDRPDRHDELDDEILSHLEMRTDDLIRQGLTPAEARRRARLEFGGVEGYKAEARDATRGSMGQLAEQLRTDLRVAGRRLLRSPLFVLFAAISIAVGVAITATVYAILQDTVWRPVAVDQPETLIVLSSDDVGFTRWRGAISRADFEIYATTQQSFASLAFAAPLSAPLALSDAQDAALLTAVSGSYFSALGIAPALGRLIGPADDAPGAPPVIVINHRAWRRAFQSDPSVVGRAVRIGDLTATVIGVTADGFSDLDLGGPSRARGWVPASVGSTVTRLAADRVSDRPVLTVLGRLGPGVSIAEASAEARAISENLDRQTPLPAGANATPRLRRWSTQSMAAATEQPAALSLTAGALVGIAGLVLVVACTNIANLSLARGTLRRHELAIRRALGASRGRLIRELVVESGLVALLGAALSIVFLRLLLVLVSVELPVVNQNVLALEPKLSVPVLMFCAASVLLALIVFGLQPALRLTTGLERADLAGGSPTLVPASRGALWLIRSQVGIAFAFMLLAAMAVQIVLALSRNTSGIDLDRLAVGTVVAVGPRWPEPAARDAIDRIVDRLRSHPGIENVAAATGMPFGMSTTPYAEIGVPGTSTPVHTTALLASTPALFETLGIPIENGRAFDARDRAESAPVAVVSASTATELFGTTDVVGREIDLETQQAIAIRRAASSAPGSRPTVVVRSEAPAAAAPAGRPVTIVGVARDTDVQSRMSRRSMLVYVPFTQHFSPGITIAVRTREPEQGVRALRTAVAGESPDLTLHGAGPAGPMLAPVLALTRVAAGVAIVLGSITLVLAMVGLHGVMSYVLASRTREMGLRLALGATARQLARLTLAQGLRPVVHGVIIGVVVGTLARLAIARMSRGAVSTVDVPAILVVSAFFLAAAWLASARPVRRASRVDPNVVLKEL
ncbi:MAG TPA: ABC transporter permease [Vicinamibacterales bacterium]|nr:ABC transporter permease [Vicinamibacterales bacterium]